MTGGLEGGYGTGGGSPIPTDGTDDERPTQGDSDEPAELTAADDLTESSESSDNTDYAADSVSRPSRPFRGWGAAYEAAREPGLWERFTAWLRGMFSRSKSSDETSDEWTQPPEAEPSMDATPRPIGRSSFDDLDAPWADPFPANERRSSRPSSERPSVEDFQTTWDGSYEAEEEAAAAPGEPEPSVESIDARSDDASDPLWDAPIVAASSAEPPQGIASEDFQDIWAPRESAEAPVVPEPEPPRLGFFSRLFGRKPKAEPSIEQREADAATAWATDLEEAKWDSQRDLEPADADFADDTAASTIPADTDFATPEPTSPTDDIEVEVEVDMDEDFATEEPAAEAPPLPTTSTAHSAADAASLAALLGPITPRVEEEEEEEQPTTTSFDDATFEQEPDEAPADDIVVDDDLEISRTDEAALPTGPVAQEPKKPGFFRSLLKRVSRSQFLPKKEIEAADQEAPLDAAASAEVFEEEITVIDIVAEPVEASTEAAIADDSQWAPPVEATEETSSFTFDEPAASPPAPADLESTQPFPAFRDARDDFADDEVTVTDSRPTEQVEIPAFDEGEKTDEFQVIPGLPEPEPEADAAAVSGEAPLGLWDRLMGRKPAIADPEAETAAAAAADTKVPFVLAKFRIFYNEVIRDKHQKSDVISGFATAVLSAPAADMADPEFAAQLLSKRLSEMLELQAAESNWTGGDAAKYYPEAQYAMVALADETFATTDWPGRSSWHKYMLEPRMYGTRGADIEFFKRVDKLLKDPDPPKGARDLARVYLLVIASGFRGKFRVPNVKRPLAEYRRRLYEFSHRADPLELYARDRRIFPSAVANTLASRAIGRFTSRQKWIAAVLVLAVLYAAVSQYAWVKLSAELKDVMSRIETTDASTGRTP